MSNLEALPSFESVLPQGVERDNPVLQAVFEETRALSDHELLLGGADYERRVSVDEKTGVRTETMVLCATPEQKAAIHEAGPPDYYEGREQTVKERRLALGDLIAGGARIKPGTLGPLLQVTEGQWNALSHASSRALARRVLLDGGFADIDLDAMADAELKKIAVKEAIVQALEPYSTIFDHRVPSAEGNARTRRGQLKEQEGTVRWDTKQEKTHVNLRHDFSLWYQTGEQYNRVKRVEAEVERDEPESSSLELKFEYGDGGGLEKMSLRRRWCSTGDALYEGTIAAGSDNQVSGELDRLMRLAHHRDTLTVNLNAACPYIETAHPGIGYDEPSVILGYRYVFDPEQYAFVLKGNKATVDSDGNATPRPSQLSVTQFLNVVHDMFGILPTGVSEFNSL